MPTYFSCQRLFIVSLETRGQTEAFKGRFLTAGFTGESSNSPTVFDQREDGKPVAIKEGAFAHPLDMNVSRSNCTDCHTGKGIKQ